MKTGTAHMVNGRHGAVVKVAAVSAHHLNVLISTLKKADRAVKSLLRKEMGRNVVAVACKVTAVGIFALCLAIIT